MTHVCSAHGRLGIPCKDQATFVATGSDGREQWFTCSNPAHQAEAMHLQPLQTFLDEVAESVADDLVVQALSQP